ncbi:hypothetical protein BASA83_004849 [Batrachochytrium salamandrivorans]|nr:hypothetical protein BASA83_004849 [Batrachochytrium salamandrivorans]
MWIDTAGTLPAGSQLTVLPSARIIMPRPHRFMLHSPVQPTTGPDLLHHLRLPPRSQVYTFSTPGSSARPSSLVVISELLVLVQTECDGQLLVHTPPRDGQWMC